MPERIGSRGAVAAVAGLGAAGLADAAAGTTFNEAADFGNTFATRTILPIGTDVVNGSVFPFEGDSADYITFHGLPPGGLFTLSSTNNGNDSTNLFHLSSLDAAGQTLDSDSGPAATVSGTVPASGEIHFGMSVDGSPGAGVFYQLTLPEPSATLLLGGGVLAVAALRRVRGRHGP